MKRKKIGPAEVVAAGNLWRDHEDKIRARFGEAEWGSFLCLVTAITDDGETLTLGLPSLVLRDIVVDRFCPGLETILGRKVVVVFRVQSANSFGVAAGAAGDPRRAPLKGLKKLLRAWGPSVRQGLLTAVIPGGRPANKEYFSACSELVGLVNVRDGHGWSFSHDDPSENPDAMFAVGRTLAGLLAVLYGVSAEEVLALVGAAVLGLDADGTPGGYTWEPSFTDAQKRDMARCDDKDDGDDDDDKDPGDAA